MNSKLYQVSFCVLSLFGLAACDLSPDALVGKKAVRPEDPYPGYQRSNCSRTLNCVSAGFTEELSEVVTEVSAISKSDISNNAAGPYTAPEGSEIKAGVRFITRELRDKSPVTVAEAVYRKTSGSAYERKLVCQASKFDPQAEGYSVTDCFLVLPKVDSGTYRLVKLVLQSGDKRNVYEVAADNSKQCSSYENTVEVGSDDYSVRAQALPQSYY